MHPVVISRSHEPDNAVAQQVILGTAEAVRICHFMSPCKPMPELATLPISHARKTGCIAMDGSMESCATAKELSCDYAERDMLWTIFLPLKTPEGRNDPSTQAPL